MKRKNILFFSLLSLCAPLASAQDLSEDLGEMPYRYPKKCDYSFDSMGFGMYANKDCDVLFLAPRPTEKPIKQIKLEANIALCEANDTLNSSLTKLTSVVAKLSHKLAESVDTEDDKKFAKIQQQWKEATVLLEQQQKEYARFASVHASTIATHIENSVSRTDLDQFEWVNRNTLKNLKENRPYITIIDPQNSIYSFTFTRPAHAPEDATSIISSDIPGLELLAQQSSKQSDVAHVKADRVTGKTKLSLFATCGEVEKKGDKWVAKERAFDNTLTINRNYELPMKIGYGIKASLDSRVSSEVLADLIANTHNHGLSKTQFYENTLSVTGKEVYDIKIDTEIPLTQSEKESLEHDIRKRLVDRFLWHYQQRGDLANLQPVEVKAPEGGEVPVQYVGTHCWSKSGFLGIGGSGGCRDYIYTVKEWREGMTSAQIKDHLRIDLDVSETKKINDVVMVPMSTTFFEPDVIGEKGDENENL